MKNFQLTILFVFLSILSFAQERGAEMADIMRKEGKIYVVVAVILTILAGIIFYLIRLDNKISRLEKETS